ncbi:hypothetical protein F5Y01DRAFT_270104 [Xylaria sp. FL0043]|nr:hypothetical protein F5Y01DRAFT_270104 [Xylaria sp. FL0043]
MSQLYTLTRQRLLISCIYLHLQGQLLTQAVVRRNPSGRGNSTARAHSRNHRWDAYSSGTAMRPSPISGLIAVSTCVRRLGVAI